MIESIRSLGNRSSESSRASRGARPSVVNGVRLTPARKVPIESAAYLKALLASSTLLIAVKDLEGRYLEVNQAYARVLGLEVDAVRGRLDRDLLPPDVSGDLAQRERLALRGVVLKPELESFSREMPTYLVERLPIRDAGGELRAVCLIAMETEGAPRLREVAESAEMSVASLAQARGPFEPLETDKSEESSPSPRVGGVESVPPEAWLSERAATKQLDWDAALYRSLLSRFCQRYEGFGQRFIDRLAKEPVEVLAGDLGRLAAGARNLGAVPLSGLAHDLRVRLESGGGEEIAHHLARFTSALDATILVIESRLCTASDCLEWPASGVQRESKVLSQENSWA